MRRFAGWPHWWRSLASLADEELLVPAGGTIAAALARLADALEPDGLTLVDTAAGDAVRVYLDTFDGRLGAAGLEAIHTRARQHDVHGRLAVIDRESDTEHAAQAMTVPGGPLLAVELAGGPLREVLLPVVDVRALLAQAELAVRTSAYAVCDELGKTVVRLTVERPALHGSPPGAELAARLRVSGLRGYARETARVAGRARELGFTSTRRRLLDEAVLALGGSPGGTSSKVGIEVLASQRSDAAAAAILRRLAEVIEANLEGTIADLDAEFLHDLRVAVRRSRSVQRELRGVFPPTELAHFRSEFRRLQRVTGSARDLDVYVLEWGAMRELVPEAIRDDLGPVLQVLRDRRALAHRAMVRELRSERMSRLLREWDAFLEGLVETALDQRPQAQRAIGPLAGERIAKVYRRMLRLGGAIAADSPAEAYHEVRKQGKELRYLLELFGAPLFDAEVVRPMIRALKALQDVLGRHQDRGVQQLTLREIGRQVSTLPGRTEALMAMGVLLERLHEDELVARAEFAESFAEFSVKALRRQVKATFA
jgi:CHAD domain-containing protein